MKLRFIFSEVGKGLNRNRAMSVSVIIVTFLSLLFVGIAGLSQMQIGIMKSSWYDKVEVSIFMCSGYNEGEPCNNNEVTDEQLQSVRNVLKGPELGPLVKEVFEEDKAEAYKVFQKQFGDSDIALQTTEDMMQRSFRVKLEDPQKFSAISAKITGMPGVEIVSDQKDIIAPLFKILDEARMLSLGIAGLMIVAAVLLITTTIRLSAMSREEETSIMRFVGASNLFIQAPFMIEGALAALTGAVFAIVTLFAGMRLVVGEWLEKSFPWTAFVGTKEVTIVAVALAIASLLLALIASAFSLAKYTRV